MGEGAGGLLSGSGALADQIDWGDEAVAAAGDGFDVAGVAAGVAEGLAQLVHGAVQAMVEVDEGVRLPELAAQFVARHQVAAPGDQADEDIDRAAAQADLQPLAAQLARRGIELEGAEAIGPWRCGRFHLDAL
jgi:hypothetical protein